MEAGVKGRREEWGRAKGGQQGGWGANGGTHPTCCFVTQGVLGDPLRAVPSPVRGPFSEHGTSLGV